MAWAEQHRPVVEGDTGVLTCTVAWRRPGGTEGEFSPITLTKPVTAFPPHHTGPADVQLLPQLMQERTVAEDDQTSTVGYRVTVKGDAATDSQDFEVGDIGTVTVVDGNADQSLLGKSLTVRAIERPALGWERYLLCSENLS